MRGGIPLVCLALASIAAQGEVVVSAHRVPTAVTDVSSSVSTVSAEDIAAFQRRDVASAIQLLPGVHVVRSGGPGQTANIFVRGARIDDLVVLVDGVEFNDPSLIGRNADLSLLDLENVERIEVLRGPQSALYGSDALGGVIDIRTARGQGAPSLKLRAEAGSYDTYRELLQISGGTGMVDYAFTATRLDTDGFSAASEADGNVEADGIERTGFGGHIGIHPMECFGIDVVARYMKEDVDYDNGAGPGADSDANVAIAERMLLGATLNGSLLDEAWQPRLSASMTSHNRDFYTEFGDYWYNGRVTKIAWQNDIYCGDVNALVIGAEHEVETAETDSLPETDSSISSLYAQDRFHVGECAVLSGGVRVDDHDTFGDELTYRVGATVSVPGTGMRLKGTYGTGVKAPSLYQLYAPASPWGPVGNADLVPQTSKGWDAGIEQVLAGDRVLVGATYFDTCYDDLIDFVAGYENVAEAETKGVEVVAAVKLCEALSLNASYTYTESEGVDGEALSRRPEHRAGASLRYTWNDRLSVALEGLYVGSFRDAYFDSTTYEVVDEDMPSYTVFNLAASLEVTACMTVFGRIENLTDTDYEQLAGYGTAGLSGYGGIEITL